MRKLLTVGALIALAAGCQPGRREVVVTRDQLGEAWPLQVNSAKVVCSAEGGATHVRIGRRLYGLGEAADGAPPVSEVMRQIPLDPRRPEMGARPADPTPLLAACDEAPGDMASR